MTPVVAAVVCFLMALPGNKIFPSSCKPSASSVLCNHSRSARIRRKSAKSQVSLLFPPTPSATPQKVSCAAAGTLPIFRAREGPGTKLASAAAGRETDVTNSETCVIFDSDRPTQTNAILMPLPDDGVLSLCTYRGRAVPRRGGRRRSSAGAPTSSWSTSKQSWRSTQMMLGTRPRCRRGPRRPRPPSPSIRVQFAHLAGRC